MSENLTAVTELTKSWGHAREKILSGKIVYCLCQVWGNTSVYWHSIGGIFLMLHFWHIALYYYTVITLIFRYCTVSMRATSN